MHLSQSTAALPKKFQKGVGKPRKSLKIFGIDQYDAVRKRAAAQRRDAHTPLLPFPVIEATAETDPTFCRSLLSVVRNPNGRVAVSLTFWAG
ncbi:hypothetical protein [Cyanobium sp. Alchichica 3B3-8F6]|uniref:hypothetical protein n=1 Tax=Cyanobium sp. Alchichica 3B3-8F6 TaxID=2823696 RepID=UPI0020CC4B27|nr:hypothetical protein [Cyanobium sp. Alchichica 3B3-8F6]